MDDSSSRYAGSTNPFTPNFITSHTCVIRGSATCTSKRAVGLLHIILVYVACLNRPCRARLSGCSCGIFGKSFSICSNRPCAESVASNTYCSGTTACARKRNQLKNETRVSDQVEMSFSRNYKHDNNWCWRKNAFTPYGNTLRSPCSVALDRCPKSSKRLYSALNSRQ